MSEMLETINNTYSEEDAEVLTRAYYFAKQAHEGQKRASGEEYFIHPCAVAQILIDLGMDCATVAGAFLHDTIEDTYVSEGDIRKEFGDEVLQLVQGVTKLDKIEFKSAEEEEAENFKKIFVSMAKDIRVIIIKLADRLHNMRSLNFLSSERQQRISKETLDIYAPLAGRLGISQIKCELEDLCLKYIDPEAFEYLATNIHAKIGERRQFVDSVVKEIQEILAESSIEGEVFGRPKHFYSIYKKMKKQNKTLDQIYDLLAVRVIVGDVGQCYELLGKIHNKWKPVPGRIKDYIAMPKQNMYQSLHTTVVTEFGQMFEIQIRTSEMHRMAEYGIAAHWKYKESKSVESNFDTRLSWIREVMEWQGGLKDSKEFIESLKGDVYSSEVLVFTPKGSVKSLVKDATPIDFAYSVHTEVGHRCVGAKVNGKIVPLNTTLQVGDVVDIITNKNSKGPSWDWLKIAKSAGAKSKIRQFFRREMHEENIKLGRSMLEQEARNRGYSFADLLNPVSFERIKSRLSVTTEDELYMAVGGGIITVNQVLVKLVDIARRETPKPQPNKNVIVHHSSSGDVVVKGMEGLLIRFAGCCNPVPGDKIIGFVSRGRGVTVHRADCPNMRGEDPERKLEAQWSGKAGTDYIVSIEIRAEESASVLQLVSGICAQLNLFITSVNGRIDTKLRVAIVNMTIKLNTAEDLDTLIKKISADKSILEVFRTVS